jgi:hypothetical protein
LRVHITAAESSVIIATFGVVGIWLQTRRSRDGNRAQIKQDLEILRLLPDESGARADLLTHIESEIGRLIKREDELTRDPPGIRIAIFLLIAGVGCFFLAFINGSRWLLLFALAAYLVISGIVGLSQTIPKRQRDAKGNTIKG